MGLAPGSLPAGWIHGRRWEAGGYTFSPLLAGDIEAVRQWRNAQLDVLRQTAPLSQSDQERWFGDVVEPTHTRANPEFLLVAGRRTGSLVSYGGVTNVCWPHLRAEVSFLADPARAANPSLYEHDLRTFLQWLDTLAFGALGLNRLFTETYAFRTAHIAILEAHGYVAEGRMRSHVLRKGEAVDSLVHGRLRTEA